MDYVKNYLKDIKSNCLEMFNNKFTVSQMLFLITYIVMYLISNIMVLKNSFEFNILGVSGTIPTMFFTFPITYVISDVFSEVWGYKFSSFTRWVGVACQLIVSIIFSMFIAIPGAPSVWTPEQQSAVELVLGSTWRVTIASIVAFAAGDFVNDKVFAKMKKRHGDRKFASRAIVSSVVGGYVDNIIFYGIGLTFLFPILGFKGIMLSITAKMIVKIATEIVCLPLSATISTKLKKTETYLG